MNKSLFHLFWGRNQIKNAFWNYPTFKVTFAEAHKQKRNEGFVEFASERDMKSALEKLNGVDLDGRRINLIRQRFRSRLGSKSRSRSRSPRSGSRQRCARSRSRSQRRSKSRSQSPAPKVHFRSRSKDDTKGQKISKAIFLGCLHIFQKTNEKISTFLYWSYFLFDPF